MWTADANEYYTLIQFPNWHGEGVDGYLISGPTAGDIALHRLVLTGDPRGVHLWTTDPNELAVLTAPGGGWTEEQPLPGYLIQ